MAFSNDATRQDQRQNSLLFTRLIQMDTFQQDSALQIGLTGTITSTNHILVTQNIVKLLPIAEIQIHLPKLYLTLERLIMILSLFSLMAGWEYWIY